MSSCESVDDREDGDTHHCSQAKSPRDEVIMKHEFVLISETFASRNVCEISM